MQDRTRKVNIKSLLIAFLAIVIMLFVFLLTFDEVEVGDYEKLMMINCCNGSYCTDTFYIERTNTCHFVNCGNPIWGMKGCSYEGKGLVADRP